MAQAPFIVIPALVAIATDYERINAQTRGYVADQLVPRVAVDAPDFRYPEYPVSEAFTVYDNQVDRLGRLNEITSTATEATGSVKDYGLAEPVPYRDEMAAQAANIAFNVKARAVRNVSDKNQLAREIRVAAMLQTSGNYAAGYTEDEAGTPWSGAGVDIPQIVENRAQNMLLTPNTAFMSKAVHSTLRRHPSLSTSLGGTYTSGKTLTDEEIAQALGVSKIVVGNTLKQTSKRGQTLVTGPIWGNHFGLLHVPQVEADGMVNDVNQPAFAMTFTWGPKVVGETPDPDMGLWGGVRVKNGESMVEKIVAPFGGYLFTNVIP
jgi:hypothetical protein